MADQVHDDTQVSIQRIINEQLTYSGSGPGFAYNENVHLNETNYQASGPDHVVEQGTFTETYGGETITGKFDFTENGNHVTSHSDYTYSYGGNTIEYKSNYESNGNGYNIVQEQYVNGQSTGVSHYHS